jgi:uncharacterized membrane protein YqjE
MSRQTDSEGFVDLFRETADSMVRLLAGHLKLARLELMDSALASARLAGAAAFFAVLAAIGYTLMVLGIAAWLQPLLGWATALTLLGAVHLLGGGVGTLLALRRLGTLELLPHTTQRAAESVGALHAMDPPQLALEQERAA